MRVVIQKVSEAKVEIDQKIVGEISHGLLILLGIEDTDSDIDIAYLAQKICMMRIFNDSEGRMNLSLNDVKGALLVVSQFTLYASTKKGNRPSYIAAAHPEIAALLYKKFIFQLEKLSSTDVKTGVFGAQMKVSLVNDGPVTILLDSKKRE